VTHRKSAPVITTLCPPDTSPDEAPNDAIVGVGSLEYVCLKFADPAVVPPGVVTLKYQSAAETPHVLGGTTTAIDVVPETVNEVALMLFSFALVRLVPNLTAVAPLRLVPVNVTEVPPLAAPVADTVVVKVGEAQLYV
jgi:hypothetical protein